MKKNTLFREILTLILLIASLILGDYIIRSRNSNEIITEKISLSLKENQNKVDSISALCKDNFINANENFKDCLHLLSNNRNIASYIFKNDSLIFWNTDINDPNSLLENIHSTKNIFEHGNKVFYIVCSEIDSYKIFTSTLLYHKKNNDENNTFILKKINGAYKIDFYIEENEIKFNLDFTPKMNDFNSYIIGFLIFFTLIITFSSTYKSLKKLRKDKNNTFLFFITSSILFVLAIILQKKLFVSSSNLFSQPCFIYDSENSFSLGLLAEFVIFLFSNIIVLTSNIRNESKINTNIKIIISSTILASIILIYTYLIYELISKTDIPFSFLQIYNTTVESYFFLMIICILSCSFIILLQNLMKIFVTEKQSYLKSIIAILLVGAILELFLTKLIDFHFSIITNIITILLYLILIWERKSNFRIKKVIRNIGLITLISTQLTYILYLINETKERNEMEWFANVIGDESDEAFEDAIIEITERIKNDKSLTEWQKNNDFPSDDSILNYFNTKYFNTEEIEGYNKVVTLCDTTTILVVSDLNNHEINCNELFNEILEYNYTKKISEELTLVDDPTTDSYYILKLDLSPIDTNYLNICYIEFYKEYILNFIGIPEIITSYKNVLMPNLVNYSFSCYNENILQYKFGHYNYPNELSSFRYKDEEYVKTKIFKHLTKLFDGDKTIIVTVEKPRFIDTIAPFSYIFIVLSLIYFINIRIFKKEELINIRQSFHAKMQLTIILTLGFAFLVAGFTSFAFIRNSLNRKTTEFQYEKNKSIVKNIEYDINKKDINNSEYLKKYKENHFTDINIYDTNGFLVNTTQSKLFEGFKSKIINKEAYENIQLRKRFYYSCTEEIEGIEYNSSYFPLLDENGNIHSIINIPFFDNKMSNNSNISNFIITYLNIFLVVMGISALIVILMTRKTLQPLEMIQDKMQKINLGGKNEAIEWKSKDEIGDLIEIYNKLIKELEISANKLMRSERETAWREMARQVAHEIKNPLTPMKLNIQFLQMAWDEKNPDIDRKLRETTKSILEQIDILSNIATAFSDYAKLPKKNIETFNLKEVIVNTINLYNNNDNIKIDIIEENESDYVINSDKNNLSIVFGNILKNAIQAIGKKENGRIEFRITDNGGRYRIEISDNGCGIGEEEKKKIFMPNFTTKSSGMGVGLSIVYDILETLGGNITFESEVGKGTTFIVEIQGLRD
ncbi:MAG: HAMP domain-containing histidine kinase [Bacteroidales bacterium]|nr:HAMP domain-containing histidine kinase [Bacteroidales bacterium]